MKRFLRWTFSQLAKCHLEGYSHFFWIISSEYKTFPQSGSIQLFYPPFVCVNPAEGLNILNKFLFKFVWKFTERLGCWRDSVWWVYLRDCALNWGQTLNLPTYSCETLWIKFFLIGWSGILFPRVCLFIRITMSETEQRELSHVLPNSLITGDKINLSLMNTTAECHRLPAQLLAALM